MAKKQKASAAPEGAVESNETSTALVPVSGGQVESLKSSFFETQPPPNLGDFKQASLPPIIKPREMPIGASVIGRVYGVIDSPIAEYKNPLLQLRQLKADGNGTLTLTDNLFAFPVTATVEKALATHFKLKELPKGEPADAEYFQSVVGSDLMIRNDGIRDGAKKKGGKNPPRILSVFVRPGETSKKK